MMEVRRYVLLAAIAVVLYLLILQWNQDYGGPQPPVAVNEIQPSSTDAANTLASAPDEVPSVPSPASDVPTLEPANSSVTASSFSSQEKHLIEVTTPLLHLKIDPQGGDVVYAALRQYARTLGQENDPFVLLDRSPYLHYIAQSGLIGPNGPDAQESRPLYSSSAQQYQLADGQDALQVDLHYQQAGAKLIKRFTFARDSHSIGVSYLVDNQSQEPWQANMFGQLKRDNSGDPTEQTAMGLQSYLGAAFSSQLEKYQKVSFDDIREAPLKVTTEAGWIAILQHYFLSAWVPAAEHTHSLRTKYTSDGFNIISFTGPALQVAPGQQGEISAQLYLGPKIQSALETLAPALDLTVDYGWLWFIAQPMFIALDFIYSLVGNWGWAIVLITLLIKLLFYPLSATSYKSMANMRKMAPKLQQLRERYGNDRQQMSKELMDLYRKEKINPLGGCLPILIQMPFFIALYWVLMESVEIRHSPFILWIDDLSVKDPYFVLPLLMGASMYAQTLLNPMPQEPIQARVMKLMPIIFTFFFLWFPSGLVLYWVVNNVLSISQQWYITHRVENAAPTAKKT